MTNQLTISGVAKHTGLPIPTICRAQAQLITERPTNRVAAAIIGAVWVGAAALVLFLVAGAFDII